ncbi:MAG TPA: type II CAAX endopeptidase family protein [Terriglobales bacterium]|nr:type II CAAX endopeptidase family protein [Terriglobales bacterium]
MDTKLEETKQLGIRPAGAGVWTYLALAFAFSWIAWLLAIKLHSREEFLNFGTAGPAFAAMILSRNAQRDRSSSSLPRAVAFSVLLVFCWATLALHYSWRVSPNFRFVGSAWLLFPAIFPAWIISAALSKNGGVRCLLQRLVHFPNRWSAIALLLFPAIQIGPAVLAHLFHQPLTTPDNDGSASIVAAAGAVFFLYNLVFVAVLEEPGWRGLLLDRLQEKWSPLVASLAVWLPWALWHAPLDYFRPVRFSLVMYLELRVATMIPLVIILTWLYNRSGRSIQASAMFHASMNTLPFVLPYYAPGFGLLFVMAGYAIFADRMWRKHGRDYGIVATSAATGC